MDSSLSSSVPAGPLARSLAIPIFPSSSPSQANSQSQTNGSTNTSPYGTPSKRTKTSLGSSPGRTSAIDMLMTSNQSVNGSPMNNTSSPPSSVGHMSPGTYYRKTAVAVVGSLPPPMSLVPPSSPANSSASTTPLPLSKRRNSHSHTTLTLSPSQGPATNNSVLTVPPSAGSSTVLRKPPAYPSGPSTPQMSGRAGPSTMSVPSSGVKSVPSPNGSVASTPPGTPPVLPLPRSLIPTNPLTPALAPDRAVTVTTSNGTRVVRAKDMGEHMDSVDEVVLPPAQAHQQADGMAKHRQRSMADREREQQQQQQQQLHQPPRAPSVSIQPPQPVTPPAPIVPVKHLVKLSSLSSLASLITPSPSSPPSAGSDMAMSTVSSPCPSLSPRSPLPYHAVASASAAIPPTFIILDIDETIHVNAYSPCLMMCEKGLEMYQRIISSHPNYRSVLYSVKSNLTKTLQAALQSKRTVEENTSALLNQLQAANRQGPNGELPTNNIKIFGLTARYSHIAATTRKELLKLNIDLEKSSPFPMSVRKKVALANGWSPSSANSNGSPSSPHSSLTPSPILSASVSPLPNSPPPLQLSGAASPTSHSGEPYYPDINWTDHPSHGTDAKYSQGVIYTNACEKGPVLARFLQFLWSKIEEDNTEQAEAWESHLAAISKSPTATSSLDSSPTSHSLMRIASNPIQITGASHSTAVTPVTTPDSDSNGPSPPDHSSTLGLLSAASKAAALALATNGVQLPPSKKRRDSRSIHESEDGLLTPTTAPLPPIINLLPSRIIFIDDRLQNCFSCYESLSSNLFDPYYNETMSSPHTKGALISTSRPNVPSTLEVYTCHYVPPELNHPTNQTKVDAAASAGETIDIELIECQIHHFLTHGEILNDSRGRDQLQKIRLAGLTPASAVQSPAFQAMTAPSASPSTTASPSMSAHSLAAVVPVSANVSVPSPMSPAISPAVTVTPDVSITPTGSVDTPMEDGTRQSTDDVVMGVSTPRNQAVAVK